MSFFPIPMIIGAPVYLINGSGKFEAANNQYLYRTYGSSPTSRKKGSARFLLHQTAFGTSGNDRTIYGAGDQANDSNFTTITIGSPSFGGSDYKISLSHRVGAGTVYGVRAQNLLRDVNGWYDFLVTWDTTIATPEAHIYQFTADGWVELTYDANTFGSLAQNSDLWFFYSTYTSRIGRGNQAESASAYLDGYLAELTVHDGTVVSTSDLAELDSSGYPSLKDPSDLTFGNYGGYYKFENGSEGTDSSGNSMTFTNSGVTGVNNSPTNDAANDVGLYCKWSPLSWDGPGNWTVSLAGKRAVSDSTGFAERMLGTLPIPTSGKWYWEVEVVSVGANADFGIGVCDLSDPATANNKYTEYLNNNGNKRRDGSSTGYGTSWTTGNRVGVAIDFDSGGIWFRKDGTWQNSATTGEVEAGTTTNAAYDDMDTWFGGDWWTPNLSDQVNGQTITAELIVETGDFQDAAPSGYDPLCTAHFPDGSVSDPETGSFTGNANADGPVVYLGGVPDTSQTSTINGNTITWGTDADALAIGFKIRTSSSLYNSAGSNTYSIRMKQALVKGAAQARAV